VVSDRHWVRWHDAYEVADSPLSRRLMVVQGCLRKALDQAADGPVRLISMCAGQGRDVIGVLVDHPRRPDVEALLVELDPDLVATARAAAEAAALSRVQVTRGDASVTSAYASFLPADVVMICGVFGNINDDDIHSTILELPHLCASGATVIWTRHRRDPDLTPTVRAWFEETGFEEIAFEGADDVPFGVGSSRFVGHPLPQRPERRMFTFSGGPRAGSPTTGH
jgi:hypothetical protein